MITKISLKYIYILQVNSHLVDSKYSPWTRSDPPPLWALFFTMIFSLAHNLNFQNLLVCHQADVVFDLKRCCQGNTPSKCML